MLFVKYSRTFLTELFESAFEFGKITLQLSKIAVPETTF